MNVNVAPNTTTTQRTATLTAGSASVLVTQSSADATKWVCCRGVTDECDGGGRRRGRDAGRDRGERLQLDGRECGRVDYGDQWRHR